MATDFWQELPRPFFTLAPMEDVTDTVFREILLGISDPRYLQVVFGEFVSTDGLCHVDGRPRVSSRLQVSAAERRLLREKKVKIVAQIWGRDPENYRLAVQHICQDYDFDGIDINFGCPVKKITKGGACSALIAEPQLAQELVLAAKEASTLPVSVKTRTGIRAHETEAWVATLLETQPAALILHGRTQKQMTKVPADWDEIGKAVRVRDEMAPQIPIIGNGDVLSVEQGLALAEEHGVDGVMVGRGVFHNPYLFNHPQPEITRDERLRLLWLHTERYLATWGDGRNFNTLKKFYKIYTSGFPGAARLRARLMQTSNADEVRQILEFMEIRETGDIREK